MTKEPALSLQEMLAVERRARLAAERLLEKKQAELFRANKRLSEHAKLLSDEVIEKRQEVKTVRTQAQELEGQNTRVKEDLEKANKQAVVAERRLWEALETMQDGFAVFNSRNQLLIANRSYLALFDGLEGIRPGITYAELLDLLIDEGLVDIGRHDPESWRTFMEGRWQQDQIEPLTLKLWNETYIKLMDRRAHDGDMVCLALDITETIRHEAEMEDARERAEAAARAKAAFLANMSHEIRTPMNGVVGMAELLIESELDGEQRLYADTIKNSAEALLVIINDVLDYSKIEAERLVLHPEPFDLERAIHEVLILLQPSATDKRIDLLVDYDLFLPMRFVADPGRVRQILTNLIGNAVKFTTAGHVLVRVTGYVQDAEANTYNLHVTVEDTGIGIPEDKVDLIFGEFNQVEDERNRKFEGTGLGLAITQQLVELMEGEIWVDSVLGEGSCFGFQLELEAAEPARNEDMTLSPTLKNAMIVDDLPINRMILEKQLSVMGMRVTTHRSTAAALADNPARFDLVIVDHEMPDMDGLSFADELRAKDIQAPVILITANAAHVSNEKSDAVHAVIQKPMLRRDLYSRLRDLSETLDGTNTPQTPASPQDATPDAAPAAPEGPAKMRVLAAEDNKTNQLVFRKMVGHLDIDLQFANNGLEAVDKFKSFQPELIFMDISMPQMDGKEATQNIRALEAAEGLPRTPICALTAHAMEGDDKGILEAGLDFYLTKPLRKQAITDRIRLHVPAGKIIEAPAEDVAEAG